MKKIFLFVALVAVGGIVSAVFILNQNKKRITDEPEKKFHYSIYSQKKFFEQAFAAAPVLPVFGAKKNVLGLLFNHHLLAPHFIAQAFEAVKTDKGLTVVLISPNHFGVGSGPILTSYEIWQTPYGELLPDTEVIDGFTESGLVKIDEAPFENEHGIRNIVAFLKRSLPEAKIVPLIIKDSLGERGADEMAAALSNLPSGILLAGSFDFSHYKNLKTANQHDEKSLEVLKNLRWRETYDLDTDSGPGLRLFLETLKLAKADNFELLIHSNSALVAGKLDEPQTTSYITGLFFSN